MNYRIGAKVVHPAYGPGVIQSLTQKHFGGRVGEYYVIHMEKQKLEVMVPTNKVDDIGLRFVSKPRKFDAIWQTLQEEATELPRDFRSRKALLEGMIASGDPLEVAQAIRDLAARREQERRLCYTDRKFLEEAESKLAGELALAEDMDLDDALEMVQQETLDAVLEEDNEDDA